MVEKRADIIINEQGARVVERNIRSIGKAALQSQNEVDQLNKTLKSIGGGTATAIGMIQKNVRGIASSADLSTKKMAGLGLATRKVATTAGGVDKVSDSVERLGKKAKESSGLTRFLRRGLIALGGAAIIRGTIRLADTFTNIQNRLKLVTTGTAELADVTDRLFQISNKTRISFAGTAEVFSRTALAVKDLGISQKQTLDFTESLNQAVVLSGASAQEANAGLIQLSQGLASGALRGDELRSVLEQLPAVADVISKSLGITRGQLREMGAEGKITADVILKAFKEARVELQTKFNKTVSTIGQAFTVLGNNVTKFIGEFDELTGVSRTISKAIIFLAENFAKLAKVLIVVAVATTAYFVIISNVQIFVALRLAIITVSVSLVTQGGILALLIKGWIALKAVILANPIGILLVVLTAVIAALILFQKQIKLSGDGVANLGDLFGVIIDDLKKSIELFGKLFIDIFGNLGRSIVDFFTDTELNFGNFLRFVARTMDKFIGLIVSPVLIIIDNYKLLIPALQDLFFQAFNGVLRIVTDTVNGVIKLLNRLPKVSIELVDLTQLENTAKGKASKLASAIVESFTNSLKFSDTFEKSIDSLLERAKNAAKLRTAKEAKEASAKRALAEGAVLDKEIDSLLIRGDLLRLTNSERQIENALLKISKALKRELNDVEEDGFRKLLLTNQGIARQTDIINDLRGPMETYKEDLAAINTLYQLGAISAEEFTEAQRDLRITLLETQTDFGAGIERSLLKLSRSYSDFADQIESVITRAFGNAENAIVEFTKTGKFNFSQFAQSLSEDLTRLVVRTLIFKNLLTAIGFGGGKPETSIQAVPGGGISDLFGPGGVFGFRDGGEVIGKGSGTSDSIPAFLSNKEFVINAESAQKFKPLLQAINSGKGRNFPTSAPALTAPVRSKQGGSNIVFAPVINVTTEGSSGSASEDRAANERVAKVIKGTITKEFTRLMREQMRPGGMMNQQEQF